jgi:CubicO group peptidase (beta-lactamase class C family)
MRICFLLLCFLSFQLSAQESDALPRNTPEAQHVSAQAIVEFLDALEKTEHVIHSLMVLRNGQVIAEGWWDPYGPQLKHTMYSVSKSFTATAIGFAVAENRLKVTDKVLGFFPEHRPETVSPFLEQLEIKHLLTMSVGHEKSYNLDIFPQENWIATFLSLPIAYQPGTEFLYNTAASYMLSAIIQKVTGETLLDYLKPRLLDPLGISGLDWETDLKGIQTGGWGLRVKTEDMAKFGQLFLQKGKWKGKQLLPESWIEEASTMKIMQEPEASAEKMAGNDWVQGYAYQMWRSRHNSYRGDGAFGQYILVLPEVDGVIVMTSETNNMQGELDLIWKHLLPAFEGSSNGDSNLREKLKSLQIPPLKSGSKEKMEESISGKTFVLESKNDTLDAFSLNFEDEIATLKMTVKGEEYAFEFGSGKWVLGETERGGPNLLYFAQNQLVGLAPFKTAGSYRWKDDKTMELHLKYIESPHTEIISITFDREKAEIKFENSFENNTNKPIFKAKTLTPSENRSNADENQEIIKLIYNLPMPR